MSELTPETLVELATVADDKGAQDDIRAHAAAWEKQVAELAMERDKWHYAWAQDTMATHDWRRCDMCLRVERASAL